MGLMRVAATMIVFSLATLSCEQATPPPCFDMPPTGKGRHSGPVETVLGFPGAPYSTQLFTPLILDCNSHERQVTSVTGVVFDPSGTPIDAGFTVLPRQTLTEVAQVDFVPPSEGEYQVAVTFQPNIGRADTVVNVVNDHRADAHEVRVPTVAGCQTPQLATGVVFCPIYGGGGSENLITIVDGGTVASVPATAFAWSGERVWVVQRGTMPVLTELRLDGDGGLNTVATTSLDLPAGVGNLTAAGDQVMVSAEFGDPVFTDFDGGLVILTTYPANLGTDQIDQLVPGVGAILVGGFSQSPVCVETFPDGGPSPCGGAGGGALGADSSGVWLGVDHGIELNGFDRVTGELVSAHRNWPGAPGVGSFSVPTAFGAILWSQQGLVVPRLRNARIELDLIPGLQGAANVYGVDDVCLYERTDGGFNCWSW